MESKTCKDNLPAILVNRFQLSHLNCLSWDAISKQNDPPYIFQSPAGICLLIKDDQIELGGMSTKLLNVAGIRHVLSKVARWESELGENIVPEFPPRALCEDLLVDPDPMLPYLKKIIHAPIFSSDRKIHYQAGYSKNSKCFFDIDPNLTISEISSSPSTKEIEKSKAIFDDLLSDFPFTSEAEKCHAIALAFYPFVRELFQGPSPLHLFEAPTPGTGKSLLVSALTAIYLGRSNPVMSEGQSDDEWRKRITAMLIKSPSFILIDNVRRQLDSGALSAAITSVIWEDRLLGFSKIIKAPVACAWIATGNNPRLSSEIARRTIRIRLDAGQDRPWSRKPESFRHSNLIAWAKANRGQLIWACLTIVQNWISQGCPKPTNIPAIGGFESWADIFGGIFQANDIPGFLENLEEFYSASDEEGNILRSFITEWRNAYNQEKVGVSELYSLIFNQDIPLDLGHGNERGQRTRLGQLLATLRDRQFDNFRVVCCGTKKRANQYRLKPAHIQEVEKKDADVHQGSPDVHPKNIELNPADGEPGEPGEPFSNPMRI